MAKTEASYRQIDVQLLAKDYHHKFDLFYKTTRFGQPRFVKYAGQNGKQQERIRLLMESGDLQEELYILESHSIQYFEEATAVLREFIKRPDVSIEEKTGRIYSLSEQVMKEFFEYTAPPKFLRTADKVMDLMAECMSQETLGFGGLAEIVNKDYYTYTHSVNVGLYCLTFGVKMKMGPNDIRELGIGGMLHDVGKSKVPYEIVNKKGKLTDSEFREIQKHCLLGVEILETQGCYGKKVLHMAEHHHEKYEGGGYPHGLEGEDIPYFGRICKVMDVYDALTTRRSYKKPMKPLEALKLMKNDMGEEFDVKLLDRFVRFLGPDA
jgi:HD-GYP domain-containing protein (c-di-GMP phosphodiesterase class II)